MLTYVEKRKMRSILYSPWAVAILFVLVFVSVRAAWGMYRTYGEASLKRDEAERSLAAVVERTHQLEKETARLSSERGLEEEIRNRYMVARENEKVIIVTDAPKDDALSPSLPVPPSAKGHWWDFLF